MTAASQDLAREVGQALVDTFGPHIAMDGMVLAMHALGELKDRPDELLAWLIEAGLLTKASQTQPGDWAYCPESERTGRVFLDLRWKDAVPLYVWGKP